MGFYDDIEKIDELLLDTDDAGSDTILMVCGSRNYKYQRDVEEWAKTIHVSTVLIHGDCPNSPDVWAGKIAEQRGLIVGKFPYVGSRGKLGGRARNQAMVKLATNIVAFWDGTSTGTKSVIDYANKLKKPIKVIIKK